MWTEPGLRGAALIFLRPRDMAPRGLRCLCGRRSFPGRMTRREGFVYGNAKGMLMRLTRAPPSHPGHFQSQEPLPLQEPRRTWISLNTMEIKHVLIVCNMRPLEGPRPWFSKRKPRDWEQRQPLGADVTVGSEVWESVVLQPSSLSAAAQGKGPRPAEAGTDQQDGAQHSCRRGGHHRGSSLLSLDAGTRGHQRS